MCAKKPVPTSISLCVESLRSAWSLKARHVEVSQTDIGAVPSCVSDLPLLEVLDVGGNPSLTDLPTSIFAVETLKQVSAWATAVPASSFADVAWREDVQYYLQRSPVCDGDSIDFLRASGSCLDSCEVSPSDPVFATCDPSFLSDGRCDDACKVRSCAWDGGDCFRDCDSSQCAMADGQNAK